MDYGFSIVSVDVIVSVVSVEGIASELSLSIDVSDSSAEGSLSTVFDSLPSIIVVSAVSELAVVSV